ncbi:hypothetical protein V6N11_073315 [Hibiscus sabdariffa]|uniref:Secreted protein n=1 Tax=Hibiscus sabdariffa TaxID=183260 RepID=A0ABR1ZWI4_9ROSI
MQHLLRVVLVVGILHGLEAYSTSCRNGCSAGNVDQVIYQRLPAFQEQSPKFKFPELVDKEPTMHCCSIRSLERTLAYIATQPLPQ